MQDNWTLKIDPESRDLILDDAGALETISGDETTAQAVRLTLEVYRGEFPFDPPPARSMSASWARSGASWRMTKSRR